MLAARDFANNGEDQEAVRSGGAKKKRADQSENIAFCCVFAKKKGSGRAFVNPRR